MNNNSVNYGWIRLDRWYCCKIIRYKDGICTVGIGDAIIDDVPCNELQPINGCKLPWEV